MSENTSSSAPVVAFFDLDNTLIATSSAFAFGRPLYRAGLLTWRHVLWLAQEKVLFRLVGGNDRMMKRQKRTMSRIIRGWDVDYLTKVVEEAIPHVITPKVFPQAQRLLDWHRQQGHDVIILSASADTIITPIADSMGVDTAKGTVLEIEDGTFTGEIHSAPSGQVKVNNAQALADERGYDLNSAYFYTDSIADTPLLEKVGHPVAVNPDRSLRKVAQEQGWTIEHFSRP